MARLSSTKIYGDLYVSGNIQNKATITTEGVVKLNNATNSTSATEAATPSAVKQAYDLANHGHPYIPTSASCNRNWNWSGQGGQPTWLWGGNDGTNMYVYNPSNFNVNSANWSNYSNSVTTLAKDGHFLYAERFNGWQTRLKMGYANGDVRSSEVFVYSADYVQGRNLCSEVDSLKSSVVNGKAAVINAINGRVGYDTGLNTTHSHDDYAWHITNTIPKNSAKPTTGVATFTNSTVPYKLLKFNSASTIHNYTLTGFDGLNNYYTVMCDQLIYIYDTNRSSSSWIQINVGESYRFYYKYVRAVYNPNRGNVTVTSSGTYIDMSLVFE